MEGVDQEWFGLIEGIPHFLCLGDKVWECIDSVSEDEVGFDRLWYPVYELCKPWMDGIIEYCLMLAE